jgi:hypothetical protein
MQPHTHTLMFATWDAVPSNGAACRAQVTNTGTVDADDVVLGFLVPPNAGKDGIPLQARVDCSRLAL